MFQQNFIASLSQQAAKLFPAASSLQDEIEKKLYELLNQSFKKLNLVTQEEFDHQLSLLNKVTQRVALLEQEIANLENQLDAQNRL